MICCPICHTFPNPADWNLADPFCDCGRLELDDYHFNFYVDPSGIPFDAISTQMLSYDPSVDRLRFFEPTDNSTSYIDISDRESLLNRIIEMASICAIMES